MKQQTMFQRTSINSEQNGKSNFGKGSSSQGQAETRGLLLLLSRFSRGRLCATPQTAAHQAPPSLGFSRQEHWSRLPFPSPMHESESEVKSLSRVRLLATPWTAAYQAPPSMGFARQEYWSGLPSPSLMESHPYSSTSLKLTPVLWPPYAKC